MARLKNVLELDLWIVDPSTIHSMPLLTQYYGTLNAAERERHARFATNKLKHDFLVTRAFVRDLLSRTVANAVTPSAWTFNDNEYGRPAISNPEFAGKLHFNLSHTDDLIVCIVGSIAEIGIDVENLSRPTDCVSLAKESFAQPELEDLIRQTSSSAQHQRFFEYWTLKEAYIKARGMGLSLPLEQFHYKIEHAATALVSPGHQPCQQVNCQISVSFGSAIADLAQDWKFSLYRVLPNHLISLAVKAGNGQVIVNAKYHTPFLELKNKSA